MRILAPIKQRKKNRTIASTVNFALHTQSKVTFLHVIDTTPIKWSFLSQPPKSMEDYLLEKGEEMLAKARDYAEDKGVEAEVEIKKGIPGELIVKEAKNHDFVVMRPRVFSESGELGEVTKKVLGELNKPVMLVKGEKRSFKTCLVPVDKSENSLKPLYELREKGEVYNFKKIFVVYVHKEEEESEEEKYEDQVTVDTARNIIEDSPAEVKAELIYVGKNIADSIIEYSNEVGADAIFMGRRSKNGLSHLILGSVSSKVVLKSEAPVVLFPKNYLPSRKG